MGTPLQEVYDKFLARVSLEPWMVEEEIDIVKQDWRQLLEIAIFRFKSPRIELEIDEDSDAFVNFLKSEIHVLAVYMKHEWIKRCLANWELIKTLYTDKDFSPANHLEKLEKLSEQVELECAKQYGIYDRSKKDGNVSGFTKLAGKGL